MTTQPRRRIRPLDPTTLVPSAFDPTRPLPGPRPRPRSGIGRWTPTAYGLAVSLGLAVARLVEDATGLNLVPDEAARLIVAAVLLWTLALWLSRPLR